MPQRSVTWASVRSLAPIVAMAAAAWAASFSGAGDRATFRVVGAVLTLLLIARLFRMRTLFDPIPPSFRPMLEPEALDALLGEDLALLFKHSTACPVSSSAHREVVRFAEDRPEVPIYYVRVLEERSISNAAAERLGVRHESPQVILVEKGEAAEDMSHGEIRVGSLERMVGQGG